MVERLSTERTTPVFCTEPFIDALFVQEMVAGETPEYRVVGHVVEAEGACFWKVAILTQLDIV